VGNEIEPEKVRILVKYGEECCVIPFPAHIYDPFLRLPSFLSYRTPVGSSC
jgi:hypothetical protein